jgi:hypothetical protein
MEQCQTTLASYMLAASFLQEVSELQEKRLELIVQGRGWNNDEGRALNVPAFVVQYIPPFTSLHNRIESGGAESRSRSSRPRQAKQPGGLLDAEHTSAV